MFRLLLGTIFTLGTITCVASEKCTDRSFCWFFLLRHFWRLRGFYVLVLALEAADKFLKIIRNKSNLTKK